MTPIILLMSTAASVWLSYELWRLVWDSRPTGAIDLIQRYKDIYFWFRGLPVYGVIETASYPPATYAILWPFLGWMSVPAARLLWALLSIAGLAWLGAVFRRESKADTLPERLFITLIPLSMYASGASIGNGQVIVLFLPALLTSLLLMQRENYSWKIELAAVCLFLFALGKPSLTAPFFWIVVFLPGRLRTVSLIVAGYAGLSFFASSFQDQNLLSLLQGWLSSSHEILSGPAKDFSQSNLHSWFSVLGIEQWVPPVSLIILILLGIWIRVNRAADPWLVISVAAIIARLWTYHAWYDDLLIAPSMIALFRIMKSASLMGLWKPALWIYLHITMLFMIAPGGLYLLPSPWKEFYLAVQVVIWISLLGFLAWSVHEDKKSRRQENRIPALL